MKVIKNSTLYLSVSLLQSLMGFLLLPLYTSLLTTKQFGLTSLVNSVASLLLIFFLFGSQSVVSRLYFEHNDEEKRLKNFLGSIFLSKIIWNICILVILVVGRSIIFPIIGEGIDFYPFMLIAIGIAFFSSIFHLFQTFQQTEQKGFKYSYAQIAYLVINNGISVLLLVVFKMKAEGIILGTLIADFLMAIFVFIKLRNRITLNLDKRILSDAFGYSWPIFLHALFGWGMGSVNKIILNNLVSIDIVGIFTIGFTVAGIVNMVAVALNRSYTPWFFEKMKKQNGDNKDIVKFSEFIILIYSLLALMLSLFGRELISLFLNKSYSEAWKVIPFLSFGYVFNGLYFFFVNIFNYQKKSIKLIPVYTLFSALLNILLNYLLIPKFGMIGSAVSTALSMFLLSFFTYLGSKKFFNIGYSYIRLLSLILLPAIFSLPALFPIDSNIWISIVLKFVYLVMCLLIIYLVTRKRFGDSYARQFDNIKMYFDAIKRGNKNNK